MPLPPIASSAQSKIKLDQAMDRRELKNLISSYKGFGLLSLIRALIFRSWRCSFLALFSAMILFGQWIGPIGFVSAKLQDLNIEWCAGGAKIWAKCIMSSIAMIYFARLSLSALVYKEELPKAFQAYRIPNWWRFYRHLDLVVTSLFYDTCIFVANLLIVFDDAQVADMVVDTLALEFFTLLDDEFKRTLLDYEDSFLDDFLMEPDPKHEKEANVGLSRMDSSPSSRSWERSSSWRPVPVRAPLTEALFNVGKTDYEADVAGRQLGTMGVEEKHDEDEDRGEPRGCLSCLLLGPLHVVRLVCSIGGPFFALIMVVYGPLCLARP